MLSAMGSPSYKSSLETFTPPRTDDEIAEDYYKVEENIRNLLKLLVNWVEEDISSINPDLMFYDFDLIKLRLPTLVGYLEELDLERVESYKYYSGPDPDEEWDNREADF